MTQRWVSADGGSDAYQAAVAKARRFLPPRIGWTATLRVLAEIHRATQPSWGGVAYLTEGEAAIAIEAVLDGESTWLILDSERLATLRPVPPDAALTQVMESMASAVDLASTERVAQVANAAARKGLGRWYGASEWAPRIAGWSPRDEALDRRLWIPTLALLATLFSGLLLGLVESTRELQRRWVTVSVPRPRTWAEPPDNLSPDRDTKALVAAPRPGPLASVMLAAA